jgi:hypothetical protein
MSSNFQGDNWKTEHFKHLFIQADLGFHILEQHLETKSDVNL